MSLSNITIVTVSLHLHWKSSTAPCFCFCLARAMATHSAMASLRSGTPSTQDNEDERTSSHVPSSTARGKSKASVPFSNTLPPPPPPPITRQARDLQSAVANLLAERSQRTNSSNDPGTSGLLAANTDMTGTHQQLPTTTNDPGIPVLPAAHTGESCRLVTAMQLVFRPLCN